jgi:hypothetical protein
MRSYVIDFLLVQFPARIADRQDDAIRFISFGLDLDAARMPPEATSRNAKILAAWLARWFRGCRDRAAGSKTISGDLGR